MLQSVFYFQSRNLLVFSIKGKTLGLHSHYSLNALFLEENEQTNKQQKQTNKRTGENTPTKSKE